MFDLPVLGAPSPSCDSNGRPRRTGLGSLRLVAPLSLLTLSLTAACGIEEEAAPLADVAIDRELAIELDNPSTLSADLKAVSEESHADLLAYCDVTTWNATWATLEAQVLTLVNQKRAAGATCGGVVKPAVPALTLNTLLRCSARKHSKDMGWKDFFGHAGSNRSTFAQRITSAGYAWTAAA